MEAFKLCLSGSVGIQVSCSTEGYSAVRDDQYPVLKYSKTSLYIAGHLPYLDTSSNQATYPLYPSYLSTLLFPALGVASFSVSSTCGIKYIDAQLFALNPTSPAFGGFNNPYSDQKRPYCSTNCFELIIT